MVELVLLFYIYFLYNFYFIVYEIDQDIKSVLKNI